MGTNSDIRSAFAEAGAVLAKITGMEDDATANATIDGKPYLGVFGVARIERLPLASGGYRERAVLPWVALRGQFDKAPAANSTLIRTDLSEPLTYEVADVLKDDPVHYVLALVRLK